MQYYFAPLEGITGYRFRNIHHRFFPGTDKYFMPFAAPNYTHSFQRKEKADMLPANNAGLCVVPQILSNNAEDTLWAIDEMRALGYEEIDLNLGCPMPTVANKKKGSGLLIHTDMLTAYLDDVYEGMAKRGGRLSVKTRLGTLSLDEAEGLIQIYNRFPISELIIHPRTQKDLYRGHADREKFDEIVGSSRNPVVYNGDLTTAGEVLSAGERWDGQVAALMIGRGLLTDPSLVRQCQGGAPLSGRELSDFHDAIYQDYREYLPGTTVLLNHMKELWAYWGKLFGGKDAAKLLKQIRKSSTLPQYESAVRILLGTCPVGLDQS